MNPDGTFTHPICSAAGVKERLDALHLRPNKALGQNFLVDPQALNKLLARMPVAGLPVFEIGPGLGALTEGLLHAGAARVLAVDKDESMISLMNATLAHTYAERLIPLHADVLRLPFSMVTGILDGPAFYVAGNLPYYITTPVTLRLLACPLSIRGMSFLVQQEASLRFTAAPRDAAYGPLAAAAQILYQVERGVSLSPACFYPQPEVQSMSVHLIRKPGVDYPGLVPFLKSIFAMRRKTLLNNLLARGLKKSRALALLTEAGIAPGARAEELPPEALLALFSLERSPDTTNA